MMEKWKNIAIGDPKKMMPDFQYGVETVAEIGGSGRVVETEMKLSEGSRTPKRKRLTLNGDGRLRFRVPVQVLPISKLNMVEIKDLLVRLKSGVEEIRILRERVELLDSSPVVVATSDIRSCSDGLERLPERVPQGRNGSCSNTGFSGTAEPTRQYVHINFFSPYLMKLCSDLLHQMCMHKFGCVFEESVVKLNTPNSFNVIKHPMSFTAIKTKLASGEYTSPMDFSADVRLTFSNAITYNPPKNDVHVMAQGLSVYFEGRWEAIEQKIPLNSDVPLMPSRMDVPVLSYMFWF